MVDKTKVLIIDDDKDVCVLIKDILEETGRYEVMVSNQGKEGISLAKSQQPDLILLDLIMPDMDGAAVANVLSEDESTKSLPVVFLTGFAAPAAFLSELIKNEDLQQGVGQVGGYPFIQKPISPKELVVRLETILRNK
jgi:CheY-like chemotaxis protein